MTEADPVTTNLDHYSVVLENERVRVLEYRDRPGHRSLPHEHLDSVTITMSSFRRRLASGEREVDVEPPAGAVRWLVAQRHHGENIGDTETHCFFVELEEPSAMPTTGSDVLGPQPAVWSVLRSQRRSVAPGRRRGSSGRGGI